MLTKPQYGWTDFQLEGTGRYGLSYLTDIAFDWLDQAIHGLKTLHPFCVKGFMEPDRLICTVSYWNCHITIENDGRSPLAKEEIISEYSHTNMLMFCKLLHNDISSDIEGWASFKPYDNTSIRKKRKLLIKMLQELHDLIVKRESCFEENCAFF